MALGACSSITLAKAINAAKAVLGDVAHGRDPFTERKERALQAKRKAAHDAFTLNALVDDWEELHLKIKQRPSYAARATRTIRSVFAKHLDLPAADLHPRRCRARARRAGEEGRADHGGARR